MRLGDGGADPLRVLAEILCRQGFAPSYNKIPSSLPSARLSSMVSLATMSRRVDQAMAATAAYSRKAQGHLRWRTRGARGDLLRKAQEAKAAAPAARG